MQLPHRQEEYIECNLTYISYGKFDSKAMANVDRHLVVAPHSLSQPHAGSRSALPKQCVRSGRDDEKEPILPHSEDRHSKEYQGTSGRAWRSLL